MAGHGKSCLYYIHAYCFYVSLICMYKTRLCPNGYSLGIAAVHAVMLERCVYNAFDVGEPLATPGRFYERNCLVSFRCSTVSHVLFVITCHNMYCIFLVHGTSQCKEVENLGGGQSSTGSLGVKFAGLLMKMT